MKNLFLITIVFVASNTHSYAFFVEVVSDRTYQVKTTIFDSSDNQIQPTIEFESRNFRFGLQGSELPASFSYNSLADYVSANSSSCSEPTTEQQIDGCVNDLSNLGYGQDGDWLSAILTTGGTAPQDMYVQIEETTSGESYYRTDKPEWFDVRVGDYTEPFELFEEETIDLSRSSFIEQGDPWLADNGRAITDFGVSLLFSDKFREDLRQHFLDSLNIKNSDDNMNTPVPIPASLYLFASSLMALFGYRVRKKSTV